MLARIRALFDGAGWFPGLAAALFVFALLAVLLELQSSDAVRWTGQRVTGTEIGGIVSYRWDGQAYSLDAPGYGSAKAIGVDLDPADPSNAVIDNTFPRLVEGSLVAVPAAAGVLLLVAGLTRRRRWERRQQRIAPGTGQVLDQEFVTRHLRELRHRGHGGD
ncbi:MAG TPA: hypothetical protein VEH31_05875 [Streptosporangiaceae bacterium]|nr:hypothetical protein [Streptosporangiaceae bacterium]